MNNYPWRLKVILPIIALHFIAIPILVYFFLVHHERSLYEAQKLQGQHLVELVKQEIALHQMATNGDQAQIVRTLNNLQKSNQFQSLSIFNNQGELVASEGLDHDSELLNPELLSEDTIVFEHGKTGDVMRITYWVKNEPSCHGCHDPEAPYIGAIKGTLSHMAPLSLAGLEKYEIVIVTVVIVSAIFFISFLFIRSYIVSPVRNMTRAMARVEQGDLSVRVPVTRNDELGIMAHRFNEVIQSLCEARNELEQAHQQDMVRADQLATVGEIAAGLAHEVKNPMAGMVSALEVVRSELTKDSPHREVIQQIISEAHRISGIINQLLDYARPRKSRPEWTDISMILADMQTIFQPQCQKKNVRFETLIPGDPGQILIDPGEMKQILMNILTNALDAVEPGGSISLDCLADEESVQFTIRDNGLGMGDDTLTRVFQPFFTTKPVGTGLGLAIVYRMVRTMRGEIEVNSTPRQGSEFVLKIPRESNCENPDC